MDCLRDGVAVCEDSLFAFGFAFGQPDTTPPEDERFTSISVGFFHTCAVNEDGAAACWGNDEHGQASPPDGERFGAVSSGALHTCGLRLDNSIACWGNDVDGQASHPENGSFTSVSSGERHTCAIRDDGEAVCWGNDDYGQSFPGASWLWTLRWRWKTSDSP